MNRPSFAGLVLLFAVSATATAQPITNPGQPITQVVNVRVIPVANTDGTNAAPLFGTVAQQNQIFTYVDNIWAQAGIDVNFTFAPAVHTNTFANIGTPGSNNPRPTGDLNTIVTTAAGAGILDPNPNTINLFMVRTVPGFSQTSDNTSNGLAFVGGNGVTLWAGPNLPGFTGGQSVIASVLSHEIGHNLGLDHIVEAENLMQAGGSVPAGQRLNAVQITVALNSPFSVPVPEPMLAPVLLAAGAFAWRRFRGAGRDPGPGLANAS